MSSPRITIKKVSVVEQHEEFVNEIKKLKKDNEELKKIIMKFAFQTTGVTKVTLESLNSPKINEFWEHI
jgi:hypothetical protein